MNNQKRILIISNNSFDIINFIDKHLTKYNEDKIIVYTNNDIQIKNITVITGDLYNKQLISHIINQYKINIVINCYPTSSNFDKFLSCLNEQIYYIQLSSINIYEPKFIDDNIDGVKNIINEKQTNIDLINLVYNDLMVQYYCNINKIKYSIIRTCNIFGKNGDNFISNIINNLNKFNNHEMTKDDCLYDWMSYKNLYEAIDIIINKKIYGIINVSSNISLSKVDMAGLICTAYRQLKNKTDSKIKLLGNKSAISFKYSSNSILVKENGWIAPTKNSLYSDILSIISFYL